MTTARLARAFVVLGSLALGGCGSKPVAPVGVSDVDRAAEAHRKRVPAKEPVRTHLVTIVPERTIGPRLARRPGPRGREDASAALAAWVTPPEGSGRRIVVSALSGRGEPRGGERTVAKVPLDTTDLVVGPFRGHAPGFLLAWTSLTDRGEALLAAVVGDDGIPRGKVIELSRTGEDVVWIEIVPTDVGAVCLWAEETNAGDAYLVTAAIDGTGQVRSTPTRIARGASAWHALEIPGGVGVSIVSPPNDEPAKRRGSARAGTLAYHVLDVDGHPQGPPVVIAREPTVSGDMHVAREGGRTLFAWTDRAGDEPVVAAASLDERGNVSGPSPVVAARGGAGLVGLDAGPAGAVIAWEAPLRPRGESRQIHVAPLVDDRPSRAGRSTFTTATAAPPEVVATTSGYAVLASLRDCAPEAPECEGAEAVATMLRYDASGVLVQREPLAYAGEIPAVGWGLRCEGDDCVALTATATVPARIHAAEVHARTNVAPPPSPAAATPTHGPRVTDVQAVVSGETVVDLDVAPWSGSRLLTTLSVPDTKRAPQTREPRRGDRAKTDAEKRREREEAEDRRTRRRDEPRTAGLVLATRLLDDEGKTSTPIVLSTRALAVGGIAVAKAENRDDGGVIAWVARENGDPEVHVTRIDARGRRTNDVQLTTTKGDAQDVAVVAVPGGFVVAWIDGRDGNGEVYATKVGLDLGRVAREERITRAPGDASDLVALRDDGAVWLAWTDARESPREGTGDVYVASIGTLDAKRRTPDVRVWPTAAHSRTPKLARSGAGLELAWIEEAPFESSTPSHAGFGAIWATLDETGAPVGKPRLLPVAGEGAATSVAVDVSTGSVRAIVARAGAEGISLDAITSSGGALAASSLLTLDGPPSLDVALAFEGPQVFFNDEGERRVDHRVRRARIAWP